MHINKRLMIKIEKEVEILGSNEELIVSCYDTGNKIIIEGKDENNFKVQEVFGDLEYLELDNEELLEYLNENFTEPMLFLQTIKKIYIY